MRIHFHFHITLCSLLSHVSVVFVLCVLPRLPDSNKKFFFFLTVASKKSVDTR